MNAIASPTVKDLASLYQCSTRTLVRLRRRGVNVRDKIAVAAALAGQKNVSAPMIAATLKQLETTNSNPQ